MFWLSFFLVWLILAVLVVLGFGVLVRAGKPDDHETDLR